MREKNCFLFSCLPTESQKIWGGALDDGVCDRGHSGPGKVHSGSSFCFAGFQLLNKKRCSLSAGPVCGFFRTPLQQTKVYCGWWLYPLTWLCTWGWADTKAAKYWAEMLCLRRSSHRRRVFVKLHKILHYFFRDCWQQVRIFMPFFFCVCLNIVQSWSKQMSGLSFCSRKNSECVHMMQML